jgi:PTS system mannose-specific IID component
MKLPRSVLLQVLSRSFFLQASWNYEQMQSLGLIYALTPAFRRYYSGAALLAAYRRHLEYFNTHPYLATTVIGAVLKLEEQAQHGIDPGFTVSEFKSALVAPCAAMGDAFFWGAMRPVAAVVALLWAFQGSLWGPVFFIALFNLPHFWFRVQGLIKGYGGGVRVVSTLQRWHLSDWAIYLKQALVVLLGFFAAVIGAAATENVGAGIAWGLCAAPLIFGMCALMRRRGSPLILILVLSLLLLGWFQLH